MQELIEEFKAAWVLRNRPFIVAALSVPSSFVCLAIIAGSGAAASHDLVGNLVFALSWIEVGIFVVSLCGLWGMLAEPSDRLLVRLVKQAIVSSRLAEAFRNELLKVDYAENRSTWRLNHAFDRAVAVSRGTNVRLFDALKLDHERSATEPTRQALYQLLHIPEAEPARS